MVANSNDGAPQTTIRSWAPIIGEWNIGDDGTATYRAPPADQRPFGICVSGVRFSEGIAETTIQLSSRDGPVSKDTSGRILLGYRSPEEPYVSVGLGGYASAYVVSYFDPALRSWYAIGLAGNYLNLRVGQPYKVRVRVRGQIVTLEVDEIRVLEARLPIPLVHGQLGLFTWGPDPVAFSQTSVRAERGTIFVVMQFSEPYEELYKEVILPLAADFGLRAYHAGEVFGPGVILADIVRGLVESKIVIAEITPPNQNVFYELGYAHALGKPTILLAERGKQLPFDVSGYRCLFYENSIGGKSKVQQALRKHLEAILNE
jgi:hypothetical protein